jgi:hypothetical protein
MQSVLNLLPPASTSSQGDERWLSTAAPSFGGMLHWYRRARSPGAALLRAKFTSFSQ